jgi:hypothetical protein
MTVSAVLGDGEPGFVFGRICDVMRGVAIGADGGPRVLFLQHFPAVHRSGVEVAFARMALAANVGDVQAPLGANGAARRVHVVRLVAVVAGCIGARLVLPVRPRMNRMHVAFDLPEHVRQFLRLLGPRLGGLPFVLVALHATDFDLDLLVRNSGNVLVTVDA